MTHTEALTMALEALELVNLEFVCGNGSHHAKKDRHEWDEDCPITDRWREAITAIKEALAQPDYRAVKTYHEGKPVYVAQQEPVGKFAKFTDGIWREVTDGSAGVPLYTTPQHPQQNLSCKSVQARLATAWGYVKAQPQQEPVAWIHNFIEGGISIGSRPADLERHPDRWTALFKDPKPCPTCEALARTVMLDQTSHDAAPPQRTWIGLTVKEIYAMYQNTRWSYKDQLYFALEIEAKLKEKNEH